jgi:peptidoglycan hydrolase-like protein with peptidoglycan-binding domain
MAPKHRKGSAVRRLTGAALASVAVSGIALATLAAADRFSTESSDALTAGAPTATATSAKTPAASRSADPAQAAISSMPKPVAVPLHLVSATPDGGTRASGAEPIVITFDSAVAATTPLPQVTPETPGRWSLPTPTTLRFDPDVPFVPDTSVTVVVPRDLQAADGGLLAKQTTLRYEVADGSLLRLQQLLAELHYLPVTFTPQIPEPTTRAAQGALAFDPPQGDFSLRFPSTPRPLAALWQPGRATAVTTGAIMSFENVHDLNVDGVAGPAVWAALLSDAVTHTLDPKPYTWAWTTMARPETLRIWSDGDFVFSSKANTGIAAAPTPIGSWPVFARYRSQTMKGTNPDGTKYNDPGVPYINYFNGGDAIHGFERASYGSAQSLGCIELPYDAAAQVWDLIDYGTVVTVSS